MRYLLRLITLINHNHKDMSEEALEKTYDSYYGEVGIERVDEIDQSKDKMFVLADGKNVRIAACDVELVKTQEPSTTSEVVNKRIEVMAQEIIDTLLKHEIEVIYLEALWNKVGMSIGNMQKVANDKLYGKDSKYELTIGDINRVFKR